MTIRNKIILNIILAAAIVLAASFALGSYLATRPDTVVPPVEEPLAPPPLYDVEFDSTTYNAEDGFTLEIVDGWELESFTPDRRVDRYRFRRIDDRSTVFTISVYDKQDIGSFDELVVRRYGGALLRESLEVDLDPFKARRVTADFEGTGTGADMLVDFNETTFLSLYGLHRPEGERGITINQQIDYMQQSIQLSK